MSNRPIMSTRIYKIILGTLGSAVLASCSKPPAPPTPSVPVQVMSVTQIAAPLAIIANGVVEPLQTVAIQAQVGGTLDTVTFREGDDVQAGQVLFRLDPRPFQAALRQAEATLARDQAQSQNAVRDAERYKALVAKDYVTKSQADQMESSAAAARATVQADSANVDNAKLNLDYATIRAPIGGRTGRLLVRQGNLVRVGSDPLVVINQLHPILVRFPIAQHDFPAVQRRYARGPIPVRVTTADSGRVGEPGVLAFLDNAVDSLTGTVTAKARFTNQTSGLWPGEYVNVSAELEVESNATAVPTRAVLSGQTGNYVFVVRTDKTAEVRPVSVGRVVGELTTIDKGLQAGEQVVVDGQSRLTPNARVDAKPAAGVSATTQAAK
ncbi:MAG TPA: efflux RND transporter periplasmic adaptor subunit [Gemmatimonadaceae bacterium]|nr:efflux RND transporter periplasmic adaptor subunit [Gemmatimonadaceae bacterium]